MYFTLSSLFSNQQYLLQKIQHLIFTLHISLTKQENVSYNVFPSQNLLTYLACPPPRPFILPTVTGEELSFSRTTYVLCESHSLLSFQGFWTSTTTFLLHYQIISNRIGLFLLILQTCYKICFFKILDFTSICSYTTSVPCNSKIS